MHKKHYEHFSAERKDADFDGYKKEFKLPENSPTMGACDSYMRIVRFKKKIQGGEEVGFVSDGAFDDNFYFDVAEEIFDKPEALDFFEKVVATARLLKSPMGESVRKLHNLKKDLEREAEKNCQCPECIAAKFMGGRPSSN